MQVLHKHSLVHLGFSIFVSKEEIQKVNKPGVTPIISSFQYKNNKVDYWYVPVDLAVEHFLTQQQNIERDYDKVVALDLCFGRDHGQGSYKTGIQVVMYTS